MKTKQFLIAKGNPTLLVWDCPLDERVDLVSKSLQTVEQVGFITTENGIPKLTMMGDELCINATLAFASMLNDKGFLQTSGVTSKLSYANIGKTTSIEITLPFKKIGGIILFQGIGYILSDKKEEPAKSYLSSLTARYNKPAFGFISYTKNTIEPFVYVKKTDSLFAETACGSGSIAMNILTGTEKIVQPSGGTIIVQRDGNRFVIFAKVIKEPLSTDLKNGIFR